MNREIIKARQPVGPWIGASVVLAVTLSTFVIAYSLSRRDARVDPSVTARTPLVLIGGKPTPLPAADSLASPGGYTGQSGNAVVTESGATPGAVPVFGTAPNLVNSTIFDNGTGTVSMGIPSDPVTNFVVNSAAVEDFHIRTAGVSFLDPVYGDDAHVLALGISPDDAGLCATGVLEVVDDHNAHTWGATDCAGPTRPYVKGLSIGLSGHWDATAGAPDSYGVEINNISDRTAGANALTNHGLIADVVNAQTNFALETVRGDVDLNKTSGTTRIRGATTLDATLSVASAATTLRDLIFAYPQRCSTDYTPSTLTGGSTQNSWDLTAGMNTACRILFNTSSANPVTINGIKVPSPSPNGKWWIVDVQGNGPMKFTNLSGSAGTSSERLFLDNDSTRVLDEGSSAILWYDDVLNKWRLIGGRSETVLLGGWIASSGTPTANFGTVTSGSTNYAGSVTSIGAHTSVDLTYSAAFASGSVCTVNPTSASVAIEQIIPTAIASKVTFACTAIVSGVAANCNDFSYICVGQ